MSLNTLLQYLLPQQLLSRITTKILHCSWCKIFLITRYIKLYHIDMKSAAIENPRDYTNFNDFFTRALKPETRPIAATANTIVSPVDGTVIQTGMIINNQLIPAKKSNFTVTQLLGDQKDAAAFNNGSFAVLYLAPYNYHRVHMPLSGKLRKMTYIPGKLFSVNPKIIDNIPNIFARNERVVTLFDTAVGSMAVILIGAMIVSNIETVWAGTVTSNTKTGIKQWHYDDSGQAINLITGAEMGRFKLGSTVILLFPENTVKLAPEIQPGSTIQMGQNLGSY